MKMKVDKLPDFKISVNDGFCTYEYPFDIGNNHSIDEVIKRIYKEFNIPEQEGKLILLEPIDYLI